MYKYTIYTYSCVNYLVLSIISDTHGISSTYSLHTTGGWLHSLTRSNFIAEKCCWRKQDFNVTNFFEVRHSIKIWYHLFLVVSISIVKKKIDAYFRDREGMKGGNFNSGSRIFKDTPCHCFTNEAWVRVDILSWSYVHRCQ